jgi:hypothetical protein
MKKLAVFALMAGLLGGCASSGGDAGSNTSYASPSPYCHDYTNTGFGECSGIGYRWH